MLYIGIGILGFVIIHLFDLVSIKKIPYGIKPIVWTSGCTILIYGLVKISLFSDSLRIPNLVIWVGWALFAVSVTMIILALFVNLPFRKTYIQAGVGDKLIKNGLYALVRHPGVYWETLFLFSLVLISKSHIMLIGAAILFVLNTALVVLQDRYYFPRMFKGYNQYQKETPMLLPNRQSLRAFVKSLRRQETREL
ncbi:methyltransferase family protein [Chloroflexota bacterium]